MISAAVLVNSCSLASSFSAISLPSAVMEYSFFLPPSPPCGTKFLRIYYGRVRDCLKEKGLWDKPAEDTANSD